MAVLDAGVAGLPAGYILEQLADFKNGAQKTPDPGKKNTAVMIGNAAGIPMRKQWQPPNTLLQ